MIYYSAVTKGGGSTERQVIYSSCVAETERAGANTADRALAKYPGRLLFIKLEGTLGAGKTAFTKGVASVISPGSRAKSPSYTIVNEYRRGALPLFHFDLYRLGDDADLSDIGFEEYVKRGHCVIEWSEYLADDADADVLIKVKITPKNDDEREIEIIYP